MPAGSCAVPQRCTRNACTRGNACTPGSVEALREAERGARQPAGRVAADHIQPVRPHPACAASHADNEFQVTRLGRPHWRHVRSWHTPGTKMSRAGCDSWNMEFSPAIDPRLIASVARTVELGSSAAVWRGLRRRARRLRTTTPCYESVRRLVVAERERRACLIAAIATVLEIATRRIPVLPEDVPRIHARQLARSRRWMRARARPP